VNTLRIGIVGLGANTRLRHVPGLRGCEQVEIVSVCNRRPASTAEAAREFGIRKTYEHWQDLVADPDIDAVVVGAWPFLHAPVTIAALAAGKHVLTEARMAMNADEARQMLVASRARADLVAQIVPSPFGLKSGRTVQRLLDEGTVGELREVVVIGTNDAFAESSTPLHWRQVAALSGLNMLTLGILHETLIRWAPDPVRVLAQVAAFTPERIDAASGLRRRVGTPDSVQVLAQLEGGARALYHFSGVTRFGPGNQIHFYGSDGTIKVELTPDERVYAARRGDAALREIELPVAEQGSWRVEADFVDSIRLGKPVELTDFATGLRYMEFTEAVARSATAGVAVDLPLAAGDEQREVE